jgi:enhancing lycopene biosynthesis protein 2
MKKTGLIALFAVVLLSSGCASLTGSEIQNVSLRAKSEQGADLAKADCDLRNDKGQWKAVTPGFVAVRRSAEDLLVTCSMAGEKEGNLRAISRAHGGMFGNIIFGGGIGAMIDHSKGTGYDYPDSLMVEMGKSLVRDKNDEREEQKQKGK